MSRSKKVHVGHTILIQAEFGNIFQKECFDEALKLTIASVGKFYNGIHKNNRVTMMFDDEIVERPIDLQE